MTRLEIVHAKTHSAAYAWHKYWSRKPANVISHYLSELLEEGDVVVDPFCGSGVTLREAKRLGLVAYGFDVNPIAHFISSFLADPIDPYEFEGEATRIFEEIVDAHGDTYLTADGKNIRFVTHHVVTRCPDCLSEVVYSNEVHRVNGKRCEKCTAKLSFSLSSMTRTTITNAVLTDGSIVCDEVELRRQASISNATIGDNEEFSASFVDNQRTLSSSSLTSADYFTKRNFGILCEFARRAHSVSDENIRRALLLVVTATSAQASRLIASRGGLKTGGQAWTIPGFWVPPVHLESNPFTHLQARIKKVGAALIELRDDAERGGRAEVNLVPAQQGLQSLIDSGVKADLVFLDPPYGDSVAFTEFSVIWNSFLKIEARHDDDLSISNRSVSPITPEKYFEGLKSIMRNVSLLLQPDGRVLLTFNNNDLQSWRSMIMAIQSNGLVVESVAYQEPAVIPSKAQRSISGSYVGDFYVTFLKSERSLNRFELLSDDLRATMEVSLALSSDSLSSRHALRLALKWWLVRNVVAEDVLGLEVFLKSVLAFVGTSYSSLEPVEVPKSVRSSIQAILVKRQWMSWLSEEEALRVVAMTWAESRFPDEYEIAALLDESIIAPTRSQVEPVQLSFSVS